MGADKVEAGVTSVTSTCLLTCSAYLFWRDPKMKYFLRWHESSRLFVLLFPLGTRRAYQRSEMNAY